MVYLLLAVERPRVSRPSALIDATTAALNQVAVQAPESALAAIMRSERARDELAAWRQQLVRFKEAAGQVRPMANTAVFGIPELVTGVRDALQRAVKPPTPTAGYTALRNATMALIGTMWLLRPGELVRLRIEDVAFDDATHTLPPDPQWEQTRRLGLGDAYPRSATLLVRRAKTDTLARGHFLSMEAIPPSDLHDSGPTKGVDPVRLLHWVVNTRREHLRHFADCPNPRDPVFGSSKAPPQSDSDPLGSLNAASVTHCLEPILSRLRRQFNNFDKSRAARLTARTLRRSGATGLAAHLSLVELCKRGRWKSSEVPLAHYVHLPPRPDLMVAAGGSTSTPTPTSPTAAPDDHDGVDDDYNSVLETLVGPGDLPPDPHDSFADDSDLDSEYVDSGSDSESSSG